MPLSALASGRWVYAGLNTEGFAIFNTVAYNLPEDDGELEGYVAFLAGVLSTEADPVSTADVRKALREARTRRSVQSAPLADLGQDLSFDQVAKTVDLKVLANVNCGYRNLEPGISRN